MEKVWGCYLNVYLRRNPFRGRLLMGAALLYQPKRKEFAMISELMQIELAALMEAGYSRDEAFAEAFFSYGFEEE